MTRPEDLIYTGDEPGMVALVVSRCMPACAGATPSAAPVAVRAGRLMSMPEQGKATRRLNSKVEEMEAGGIRTRREILWLADLYQHHLNWRRSAIDIEHPGAILEAF
jgi:hypothetical protein